MMSNAFFRRYPNLKTACTAAFIIATVAAAGIDVDNWQQPKKGDPDHTKYMAAKDCVRQAPSETPLCPDP